MQPVNQALPAEGTHRFHAHVATGTAGAGAAVTPAVLAGYSATSCQVSEWHRLAVGIACAPAQHHGHGDGGGKSRRNARRRVFTERMGRIACRNSVVDQDRHMIRKLERIHYRVMLTIPVYAVAAKSWICRDVVVSIFMAGVRSHAHRDQGSGGARSSLYCHGQDTPHKR
jgi:hypothetical protein